jgi:integrase
MLTQIAITKLKAGRKRREVPDGRGLYHIVQPSGERSWALRYRYHGRPRKFTLGGYPALGLKEARAAALQALASVAAGVDPAAEKTAARAAAKAARRQSSGAVERVIDDFIGLYAKPNTRDWRETQRLLKQFAMAWEGRPLAEIAKADIHRVLDGIVARGAPISANRAFTQLRKMCRWALSRGIIEHSPCEGIQAPSTEKPRDRVLSLEELRLVWRAAEKLGYPYGPITQLLILTGARRSEIGRITWDEIDFEKRLWTLPAERSKNKRAHVLPLSPQVVAILQSLPRFAGSKMVFSPSGKIPDSFAYAKFRLDAAIAAERTASRCRRGLFTMFADPSHQDLRRWGSICPVIERGLNHVSGSFSGIVSVYQRHSFADEMHAAMDLWGRRIEALVSGETGQIIELSSARA